MSKEMMQKKVGKKADAILTAILDSVTPDMVSSPDATMSLFESISQAITDQYGDLCVIVNEYAATELLLSFAKKGYFSESDLRAIAINHYNYAVDFEQITPALASRLERMGFNYTSTEDYVAFLCVHAKGEAFAGFMKAKCFILTNPDKADSIIPQDALKNRSVSFWRKYRGWNRSVPSCRCPVAESYEKELMAINEFRTELKALHNIVAYPKWSYDLFNGIKLYSNPNPTQEDRIRRRAILERLRKPTPALQHFCYRWCLNEIVKSDKPSINNGFTIRAMRVRVGVSKDDAGLTVNIPRYYHFSHIKNYAESDFQPLKLGMEEIFVGYKRPRKRKISLKYMMAEAKDYRARLKAQGMDRHDAWEATYKMVNREFGWSEETTISRLGIQPKPSKSKKTVRRCDKSKYAFGDSPD